uniref:Uncharacterized protein n=1 Tax=Roseihalotalea indica TaxID=2867963 RepID=A0AA49JIB4_9BACT|nr:hypothetical protein K4G66_17530 [Tunicatimonas sp. TK19036]
MITLLLVFSILLLFPISVYLFSKAEQESQNIIDRANHPSLTEEPVFISTIQQGKVQETWCYVNDFRSRLKHANVTIKNSPDTLERFFNH